MLGVIKIKDRMANLNDFRIFGEAMLESESDWPLDYQGNPMLFFVGVPASLINKGINHDFYCNFFITYTNDDEYLYDLQPEEELQNTPVSCIVLSRLSKSNPYSINSISEKKVLEVNHDFQGKVPYWLQNPIERDGLLFQFEIYAGEIDEHFIQDFGDECYYFFTDITCSKGSVFVQMT